MPLKSIKYAAASLLLALAAVPAGATELFVKNGVSLNCRVGPSTQHHVVKVLHAKQNVKVLEHYHGWARVKADHAVCWASASFLTSHAHSAHRHASHAPKHYQPHHVQTHVSHVTTYHVPHPVETHVVHAPQIVQQPALIAPKVRVSHQPQYHVIHVQPTHKPHHQPVVKHHCVKHPVVILNPHYNHSNQVTGHCTGIVYGHGW